MQKGEDVVFTILDPINKKQVDSIFKKYEIVFYYQAVDESNNEYIIIGYNTPKVVKPKGGPMTIEMVTQIAMQVVDSRLEVFKKEILDSIGIMLNEKLRSNQQLIDQRFDRIEARLDRVESRLDKLEARMDILEAKVDELSLRVTSLEKRVTSLEDRVTKLEEDKK